ncbi:MAG: flagellar hook-associated protein 3 [Gemmatimonadales bacterium]|nr:MAG: flagellar hook-associated protein 3 [Gemmatimonadales bacterium]
MRIPNIILQQRTLEGIQSNLREVDRAAREIASGRRISAPSDDPAAARSILRTNSSLQANEQFARNISSARTLLDLEDVALQQMGDVLSRGREIALSQGGSTASTESRAVAAREVDGLVEFLRDLANTRLGERYIFGGVDATSPPIPADGDPPPPLPEGELAVEIAPGRTTLVNHSASQIFGATGALEALEDLARALRDDDGEVIRAGDGALSWAHAQVQVLVGETGSRMSRLDLAASRLDAMDLTLAEYRSDLENVDFEEAISRMANRQAAYQGALLATSKLLSVNLVDYLR